MGEQPAQPAIAIPELDSVPLADLRLYFEELASAEPVLPVHRVESLPAADVVPARRVYWPTAEQGLPLVVFYHGGGWIIGSIDTHDSLARQLALTANCIVVSVDYRLAPEHRHPAAVDDAYAALQWVSEHADQLGGDASQLVVAGDSAGGNLAAVVAQLARDCAGPSIALQVLWYPVTSLAEMTGDSYSRFAAGPGLRATDMVWFKQQYLSVDSDPSCPTVSPLSAPNLTGLPPAQVVTAGLDVLRDEGMAYARRLTAAGVAVIHHNFEQEPHGFLSLGALSPTAECARQQVLEELAEQLTAIAG